jgi:hypothetical protein
MDKEQFLLFVKTHRWQYAKSYPKSPHEYTVRDWDKNEELFQTAVRFILDNVKPEKFYSATYNYYRCDGWKYWTYDEPKTKIINRSYLLGDYYELHPELKPIEKPLVISKPSTGQRTLNFT